jgi:hypothetical protein
MPRDQKVRVLPVPRYLKETNRAFRWDTFETVKVAVKVGQCGSICVALVPCNHYRIHSIGSQSYRRLVFCTPFRLGVRLNPCCDQQRKVTVVMSTLTVVTSQTGQSLGQRPGDPTFSPVTQIKIECLYSMNR